MCDTCEIIDLSGGIFIALFTEFGAASAPEEEVQCQWSSRRTSAKGEREIKKTKKCEEYLTGSAGSSEEVLSP